MAMRQVHVTWDEKSDEWLVGPEEGPHTSKHDVKSAAVKRARTEAKSEEPSQLIIHTQDGRVQHQHTYGSRNGTVTIESTGASVAFFIVGVALYGAIFGAVAYNFGWWGLGEAELELSARAVGDVRPEDVPDPAAEDIRDPTAEGIPDTTGLDTRDTTWIVGRIIYEGESPDSGRVWAVLNGKGGEQFATEPQVTKSGDFRLGPVPEELTAAGGDAVVRAWAVVEPGRTRRFWFDRGPEIREAEARFSVGSGGGRPIALPGAQFFSILVLFGVSLLLALIPVPTSWGWQGQAAKYITAVIIAFFLTFLVLYHLSVGLIRVQEMADTHDDEVIQLGFATIFKGTYVEGGQPNWQFSLTGAPEPSETSPASDSDDVAQGDAVAKGLGAPLWGLLLSVVGAGLYTISLIVGGIQQQFRTIKPEEVRKKIQVIVLHEFYVVFAPVGAIIVYQTMVLSGAANEPVTVALALLAAGLGLNVILNVAVERFAKAMGITPTSQG